MYKNAFRSCFRLGNVSKLFQIRLVHREVPFYITCHTSFVLKVSPRNVFSACAFHTTNHYKEVRQDDEDIEDIEDHRQTDEDATKGGEKALSANEQVSKDKLMEKLKDPEIEKLYKILQLELDLLRHSNECIPTKLKYSHWLELLELKTRSQRRKYLKYLWKIEVTTNSLKEKTEQKRARWAEYMTKFRNSLTSGIEYGLDSTNLFLPLRKPTINHIYQLKLMQAMLYEPKLVFDCSYEEHMTKVELLNCVKQLTVAFAFNRQYVFPFDLYFCNVYPSSKTSELLLSRIPTLYEPDFPLNVTHMSYFDLFDKNKLIYLTPHCSTTLEEYDPDMVYIIGAMVDKTNSDPLSYAKAKKDGIKMAKLPLDKYLEWGSGSGKSLALNHVLNILLDLRRYRDWNKALECVPKRKLREASDQRLLMQKANLLRKLQGSDNFESNDDYSFASRRQIKR